MEMHRSAISWRSPTNGNFTRAAAKCNVTQPSLTRAVRLLEAELAHLRAAPAAPSASRTGGTAVVTSLAPIEPTRRSP